jgi:hypothetical protein
VPLPPVGESSPAAPLAWWRRLGLFLLVVGLAGVGGALVEWTVRWVLPSIAAVFLGRAATIYPVFYWMPVILGETPPWTQRRRTRFAALAAVVLAVLAGVLGS